MSDSALIITSDKVTIDDLRAFTNQLNGVEIPGGDFGFVVSDGETDVWLALQDEITLSELYDKTTTAQWENILGERIGSIIEINLDHTTKSVGLYFYIAFRFSKSWKAVLYDIEENILSEQEIKELYNENRTSLTIDMQWSYEKITGQRP